MSPSLSDPKVFHSLMQPIPASNEGRTLKAGLDQVTLHLFCAFLSPRKIPVARKLHLELIEGDSRFT